MRVPGRTSSRLERDAGPGNARGVGGLKQRVDPHDARKPVGRTLSGRLRANAFDLHAPFPWDNAGKVPIWANAAEGAAGRLRPGSGSRSRPPTPRRTPPLQP